MAGRALPVLKLEPEVGLPDPLKDADVVKRHTAMLFGQGLERAQIAKLMHRHICPLTEAKDPVRAARRIIRKWEQQQEFRDMVYDQAVVRTDLAIPSVLKGVVNKAKKGRVDAARLVLEITGRHNPKGEAVAPNIVIAVNGIPRPAAIGEAVIDAEAEEE